MNLSPSEQELLVQILIEKHESYTLSPYDKNRLDSILDKVTSQELQD